MAKRNNNSANRNRNRNRTGTESTPQKGKEVTPTTQANTPPTFAHHEYKKISPITNNQKLLQHSLEINTLTIVSGPAGAGKTFIPTVYAAELLEKGTIKKIVLARPYVDLNNKGIGFLPGNEAEKLTPYVRPMLEAIKYVIGPEKLKYYLETGVIEIKALASIRGMSYDDTFLIFDEMQGTVPNEIQAVTTRLGKNVKVVISGDTRQTDVKRDRSRVGLEYLRYIVAKYPIRSTDSIEMTVDDVVRSGITKDFVLAYEAEGWL